MKSILFIFSQLRFTLIFLPVLLLLGCNKEEPIPAYIHIDKIDLTTVYANEGSSSHKITDAWIYIDDQFAGAYEMPFTIPVLYTGTRRVRVLAGIKENGISQTRIPYPFYNKFEQVVSLEPGVITTLTPVTTYIKDTEFSWKEDFENAATGICNNAGTHDTVMQITKIPSEVFELAGSGRVVLDLPQSSYLGISCDKFTLPQAGAPVFLELNYNCNTDFNVGIRGYSSTNTIAYQGISLSLRTTSGWNKIYINLSDQVTGAVTSVKFGIFFSMLKNPDVSSSYFYVDNVKLVN